MQYEDHIIAPTTPPALTIFALIYLTLLLGHNCYKPTFLSARLAGRARRQG